MSAEVALPRCAGRGATASRHPTLLVPRELSRFHTHQRAPVGSVTVPRPWMRYAYSLRNVDTDRGKVLGEVDPSPLPR
jgi:hypothetical protein